jgi:PAS domain S-box-containing protein
MMQPTEDERRRLAVLRQRAEEALRGKPVELDGLSYEDLQYLLHELQVHQTELSLQNDELRRVQEELEASRDLYSDLYNFAPAGYCTVNRQDFIMEANQTLGEMLGIEPKALFRQKLAKFVDRDDRDEYFLHRRNAFAGSGRQVSDIQMLKQSGETIYVRLESIVPPKDTNHLRVMLSDISDQKRAEAAQRASEARLILSTEAANIGIWDWDLITGERTWNERCNLLLGQPAENPLTVPVFLNTIHPDDRDRIALTMQGEPAGQK